MSFTLSKLLQAAYRKLGDNIETTATGGSTSTFIDTKLAGVLDDDDALVNGAIFVIQDAGGAGAAPENEFSRITIYDSATQTVTFSPVVSSAIAAGDVVQLVRGIYPLQTMIELANDTMRMFGDIPLYYTDTTVADQHEYTLPDEYRRVTPMRVMVQPDSDVDRWQDVNFYYTTPALPGADALLVLPALDAGLSLRVWYKAPHPRLSIFSSVIDDALDPDLVVAGLTMKALEWNNRRQGGTEDALKMEINAARDEYERLFSMRSPSRPGKRAKFVKWW